MRALRFLSLRSVGSRSYAYRLRSPPSLACHAPGCCFSEFRWRDYRAAARRDSTWVQTGGSDPPERGAA